MHNAGHTWHTTWQNNSCCASYDTTAPRTQDTTCKIPRMNRRTCYAGCLSRCDHWKGILFFFFKGGTALYIFIRLVMQTSLYYEMKNPSSTTYTTLDNSGKVMAAAHSKICTFNTFILPFAVANHFRDIVWPQEQSKTHTNISLLGLIWGDRLYTLSILVDFDRGRLDSLEKSDLTESNNNNQRKQSSWLSGIYAYLCAKICICKRCHRTGSQNEKGSKRGTEKANEMSQHKYVIQLALFFSKVRTFYLENLDFKHGRHFFPLCIV